MNEKKDILRKYLPEGALQPVADLLKEYPCHLKIVSKRSTKHGDYRRYSDGRVQITVNNDLNAYRFLITLIHEIAHLVTFEEYKNIRPHGKEWRFNFQRLMFPLLRPSIFPEDILRALANYLKRPKASTDGDLNLSLVLRAYDGLTDKKLVLELPEQSLFTYKNKTFIKGNKRRTRFECTELATHKKYIFHPNAEVEAIKKN